MNPGEQGGSEEDISFLANIFRMLYLSRNLFMVCLLNLLWIVLQIFVRHLQGPNAEANDKDDTSERQDVNGNQERYGYPERYGDQGRYGYPERYGDHERSVEQERSGDQERYGYPLSCKVVVHPPNFEFASTSSAPQGSGYNLSEREPDDNVINKLSRLIQWVRKGTEEVDTDEEKADDEDQDY